MSCYPIAILLKIQRVFDKSIACILLSTNKFIVPKSCYAISNILKRISFNVLNNKYTVLRKVHKASFAASRVFVYILFLLYFYHFQYSMLSHKYVSNCQKQTITKVFSVSSLCKSNWANSEKQNSFKDNCYILMKNCIPQLQRKFFFICRKIILFYSIWKQVSKALSILPNHETSPELTKSISKLFYGKYVLF
jgi:hypothetical protein